MYFDFKPGKIINKKYIIESKIGSGWESEVYLVKEKGTGIERTLKMFFPARNKNMKASKMQAKKLFKLRNCPIIIAYHSHEEMIHDDEKVMVLVSEFVEGEQLTEFLKRQRGKRISVFQGLHLLHALACGLEDIHKQKEYHGDLHGGNVIVKRHGLGFDLKVIDFYHWTHPKKENIQDDLFDIIRIFYDAIGGQKQYQKHPKVIREICCGLKKGLILKKFKNVSGLRNHIETLKWP